MLTYIVLLVSLVAAQSQPEKKYYALEDAERYFDEFISTFNKQYANEEEKNFRFIIFKKNLIKVNENNRNRQAVFGITKFSDLTVEEFLSKYTGLRGNFNAGDCSPAVFVRNVSAPDTFDWRDRNVVTPVKAQGQCGSCWAFSTTGNIEGQYAIKHQKLLSLSEQQVLDCCNCGDCSGGEMTAADAFLTQNGGIMLEDDYPYESAKGTCRFDRNKVAVTLSGCHTYSGHTEDELQDILVNVGPLSIGIDATDLHSYDGRIHDCPGPVNVNHAMLLVGYGTDGGQPYWIVKNSWGANWGHQGYLRLAKGVNACGIMSMVSSAVVQ